MAKRGKSGGSGKSRGQSKTGGAHAGDRQGAMSQWRGVGTFNTNETVLLVRGDVEKVASAFVKHKKARVWQKEVQDKAITVHYPSYLILQIVGHPWVMIINFGGALNSPLPKPEDAQALSRLLGTRGIYFGNSDTASATRFSIYEKGRILESFTAFEDVKFESSLHDPAEAPQDGPEIYTFVDRLIRDQDAYVSGALSRLTTYNIPPGSKFQLELETDADEEIPVVRVDFVATSESMKGPAAEILAQLEAKPGILAREYKPQKKKKGS